MRTTYCVVVRRPVGRQALGKPSRRWDYNIKISMRCYEERAID